VDLRYKALYGLIGIFILTVGILSALSFTVILGDYHDLESDYVRGEMNLIMNNIEGEIKNLESNVQDWGAWDDTYAYVRGEQPDYPKINLVNATFKTLRTNFIIITDKEGRITYGQGYDLVSETPVPLRADLESELAGDRARYRITGKIDGISGFLNLPEGPVLLASFPILHSDYSGPVQGSVIMGRFVNDPEIRLLTEGTNLSLSIQSLDSPQVSPDDRAVLAGAGEPSVLVRSLDEQQVEGRTLIRDIYGNDSLLLSLRVSRDIYHQGKNTIFFFIALQMGIVLIAGILALVFLDRMIFGRMSAISSDITGITRKWDLSARIKTTGGDEIARLADAANQMLDRIEEKHTALRESEHRFRELFNSMSSGVAVYRVVDDGVDFIFVDFNPGAEIIEKTTKKDVIGRRVSEVFPGATESGIMEVFRRVWRTGEPEYHLLSLYKDEQIASWRENYIYRLPSGEVVAIYDDITERKRAEEVIRKSEREWQTTFNAITDAVFLLDDKGRIIRHNRAFETVIEKSAVDIGGKYCYDVMHGTSRPFDGCPYVKAQKSRQRESLELKIGNRWFIAAVDPIFSDTDEISGGVHLLIEITERKQAEDALRQANRKLNLLSSITRHDIKNQILILKGFLELSKRTLGDAAKMSEYIIKEERVASAIERQILFTKEYEDVGVKAAIWQSLDAGVKKAQASLPMRDIRVVMDCPDVEVYADSLLEKVFYNLIDNALRHGGPEMTAIRISAQESDKGLVISVEDDGAGISDKDKKRLFERGFGKNTGLGLFLSREILFITGITITETGEPGKGARFEITVPRGEYRLSGDH
jgi:PAS domain S-box-containing protein